MSKCNIPDNEYRLTSNLYLLPVLSVMLKEKSSINILFTPKHNGKVERSHRKDNEEFYARHTFFSFDDFKKQLALRQRQYNNFPMRPLNWLSPKHVLFAFPNV